MAVVRWVFYDPAELDEYEFEINPTDGGTPSYRKSVQYQNTAAPDGKTLVFEGRDEAEQSEFNGTILTEDGYDAMVDWFTRRHQIEVTDDLGRTFMIYITAFEPKRERAIHHPWKHSYAVRYTILDWPE